MALPLLVPAGLSPKRVGLLLSGSGSAARDWERLFCARLRVEICGDTVRASRPARGPVPRRDSLRDNGSEQDAS